jgi:hypothetical protein
MSQQQFLQTQPHNSHFIILFFKVTASPFVTQVDDKRLATWNPIIKFFVAILQHDGEKF